jgi:DNA-binding response OmpR family regulator
MHDSTRQASVLVVDDDAGLRALLTTTLEQAGYAVLEAADGREGLRRLHREHPDLIVLDVAMPELDGFQALERIRDMSDVPVLMLTGRDGELDTVRGLRGGADDYVTKPFRTSELVARVAALLRRAAREAREQNAFTDGVLIVDLAQPEVFVRDCPVAVTPLEFKLLSTFVRHPNQVLSRDQLLELVWGGAWVSPDQVKNSVGYLRRKLGAAVEIETVRGFGYRFRPAAARPGEKRRAAAVRSTEPRNLRVVEGDAG